MLLNATAYSHCQSNLTTSEARLFLLSPEPEYRDRAPFLDCQCRG